ncbi:MAG: acyltransferase family protein [Actinobacteria bacterium]|nr:acyltransferase family protein [Actinomycetota bacterium]MBI3686979.1 acyltransferase family protein [Actinomycetota bacterium]
MTMATVPSAATGSSDRLYALDAVRAGALLLGVVFHASLSFMEPPIWLVGDVSTSVAMNVTYYVLHLFRLTVFFLMAGFFARMLLHRRGTAGFARDRVKRILLPLVVFWPIVMVSTVGVVIWSAIQTNSKPPKAPPVSAQTFPLTHLWFLYMLLIFYVAAVGLRAFVVLFDHSGAFRARLVDPLVRTIVTSGLTPIVLGAPLCLALFFKADWLMWFGVPPAENGLIPNTPALIGYGTAFGFGWLLQRQSDLLRVWERRYLLNLTVALTLTVVCVTLVGLSPVLVPAPEDWRRLVYVIAYTLAIWAWTTALVGLALRHLAARNPVIRYVADASYWIYIVHLPLVMVLQTAVAQLPIPWFGKYVMILGTALPLLLLSYHYLARSTFVGAIMNGRRYVRRSRRTANTAALAAAE